jgi:hypothetical protein
VTASAVIDFIAGEEHEVTAILAYRRWEKRGRAEMI